MKGKMNKKGIVFIVTVLILSISLASVAFAADNMKTLKAWYGDIKIYSNQKQVYLDVKPFIVDGTTYVPLRALSNIFNKDVGFEPSNYRIDINDKPDQNVNNLVNQLISSQQAIVQLEAKVRDLEAQLASKQTSSRSNLIDMESYLNKQHSKYNRVGFDIDLYGNKDKIEVRIYVDLDDYYSAWDSLTSKQLNSYIQDIVDDIIYDFEDAKISGYIEDSSVRKKLTSFTVSTKGSVSVGSKSSNYDLEDLEDYLNDEYYRYQSIYFEFDLYEGRSYIDVTINVDGDDWDYELTSRQKRTLLEDIYDHITYDYPDYDVYGDVVDDYNGKTIYNFEFDSNGYVSIY